jgi:drug/metabolite transporter (DMT)-like permease
MHGGRLVKGPKAESVLTIGSLDRWMEEGTMSRRGWLLFAIMGVVWGVPYLMIKVAVTGLTPAALVFSRTAIAALMLAPIAAARGQVRPVLRRWRPLLVFTAVEMAVPWYLLAHAEQRLSSSLSGLLIAAVPMVGALVGRLTGAERLGPRRLVGLAIGLAGVAALVGLDVGRGDLIACLEMAGVVVGYAVGPFILVRYLTDAPGLGVVAGSLVLTMIAYAPVALGQLPARLPGLDVLGAVAVLAVVCTAVAFLCFFALIDEAGPVRATVIPYLNPAVAVTLGVLLAGEPFTVGIAVGFVLVLVGSVLATGRSPDRTQPAAAGSGSRPALALAGEAQPREAGAPA